MKKHTVKRFIAINLCLLTIFSSALPAFAAASSEAESAEIDSSVASQADKQAQPETELQEDTAVPSDSDTEEPASEEPAANTEAVVPEPSEVPSASAPAESVPANDVQPLYSDGRVTIDGVEYYYKDGKPASGWVGLGGTDWIYCESDGRILKDQWLELPTGGKWYLGSDGVNYTGWNQIDGSWYYMSGPARVQYGLRTIDGKKYYFDETTGKAVENSWVTVNGEKLRTGEKGQIVDLSDGRVTIDGVEYYYKDGKPASGWVNVGHPNWIYCESDGRILKDQWLELPTGGKWYLGSDGVNYTGWNQIDGSWYYMSGPARVQYGLQTIDGQRYYFDEATGKAVENSWVTVNGERLRTGEKGQIVDLSDGRVTIDGVEYYYKDGKPASGWVGLGGTDWIYCESDGRILKDQWLELPTGGKWYLGSDGVNYTGWNQIEGSWYYMSGPARVQYGLRTIDGKKYYFDEKTGKAVENSLVTVSGEKLRTGEKGELLNGRATIDGVEYYYQDGKPVSGWVNVGHPNWIYCESDGRILKDQWLELPTGGKWYLGSDGVNYTGWNQIDGSWYYMSGPARVQYGLQTIDGQQYYFDEATGKAVENSWVTVNGERLRTGEKGLIVDFSDGRVTIDGVEYYYKGGKPASGWVNVGHPDWIYCESDGRILKNQWLELPTGGKWYLGSDGVNYTGWNKIEGSWYYMSGPARVQYGLQTIDGKKYYFDEKTGKAVENSWVTVDGKKLRTGEKGILVTGRLYVDGTEYYFQEGSPAVGWVDVGAPKWIYCDKDGQILKNQWLELPTGGKWYLGPDGINYMGWNKIDGSWYYMSGPARVQYGLQTIDGKKYYFDEKTGKAVENSWVTVDGKKLRTGEKGILVTGRLYVDGTEYYFQEGSPAVGWVDVGAPKWIYCDKDGRILKNQWLKLPTGGKWYLGPDGVNYMGWNQIDGSWYYMDGPARVQYGLRGVDGYAYIFDTAGRAMAGKTVTLGQTKVVLGEKGRVPDTVTGWIEYQGVRMYLTKGKYSSGWALVGKVWYCFNDKTGIQQVGWQERTQDGKIFRHYYKVNGAAVIGWYDEGGNSYYFETNGAAASGWKTINGKRYYFDLKTNSAYKGKWYHENGNSYYFETNGAAASGWKTIDGKQYYFDLKTNAAYKNKQVVIDGVTYKFDQNGVATKVDDFAGGVLAIDVSYHQGTIDWKKVAESGVEYAIIRSIGWNKAAGTVGGVDSMFDYNFREAKKYGIKVGTYIYTYASTTDEVIAEINAFDAVMKKLAADGYTLDLPVFIDQEDDDLLALSYNQRTELLRLGMVLLDQKGYYPGMYMYSAWAKNNVNTEQLLAEGYDLWIADVRTSVQNPDWNGRCVMWQYSWEGSIPGIAGNVDMNKLYKDYSGIIHGSNNAGQEAVAKFKVYDQNSGRVVQDTMPRLLAAIVSNEVGGGLKLTGADRMKLYQAQAIAAHSWLLYSYGEGNEQPSVGLNYGGNFSLILSQIESVQDMILTYGGKPALTVYGSCGNGKTNASGDYWSTKLPYLVAGIESKYDKEWSTFNGQNYFPTVSRARTSAEVSAELKQKHNINTSGYSDPSKWFVINKRNEGGYIVTLTICGKTIKGGTLNDNFSPILSADFTVEYNKATDIFTFKSNGNGHGIGMSQFGAAGYIAKEGWSYQQVLAHYYPGTILTTVD